MPSEETQLAVLQMKYDALKEAFTHEHTLLRGAWDFIKLQHKLNEDIQEFMKNQHAINQMHTDNYLNVTRHGLDRTTRRSIKEEAEINKAETKYIGTLPKGWSKPKDEPAQHEPVQKLNLFQRIFGRVEK